MKKIILGAILSASVLSILSTTSVSAEATENMVQISNETNVIYEHEMLKENEEPIQSRTGFWNVISKKKNGYNTIYSDFIASKKVTTTEYGLTKGKHVKQTYVRLTEGNYDSGRKWSAAAKSTTDSKVYNAYTQRLDDPLKTSQTFYGWSYF